MKLHRTAQFVEIALIQLLFSRSNWRDQTVCQWFEVNRGRDFHLFDEPFAGIRRKRSRVSDRERRRRLYFDLKRLSVDLRHALDFFETDIIIVLERMAFVVVQDDKCFFFLSYIGNQTGFKFFAVLVEDFKGVAEIYEGEAIQTQ